MEWLADAEQELARIWLAASDRQRVTRASQNLDARLGNDPENDGESRPEGRRILFEPPLGAVYRVLPHRGLVRVCTYGGFRKLEIGQVIRGAKV